MIITKPRPLDWFLVGAAFESEAMKGDILRQASVGAKASGPDAHFQRIMAACPPSASETPTVSLIVSFSAFTWHPVS